MPLTGKVQVASFKIPLELPIISAPTERDVTTSKRRGGLFIAFPLLMIFIVATCRLSSYSSPIFIPPSQSPHPVVARMIDKLGGFPKASLDLYEAPRIKAEVFPIDQWEIIGAYARPGRDFQASIMDDDPTYAYEIGIKVEYQDGDTAIFRWSTWRYGHVFYPLVIAGDGPPGQLTLISLTERR